MSLILISHDAKSVNRSYNHQQQTTIKCMERSFPKDINSSSLNCLTGNFYFLSSIKEEFKELFICFLNMRLY